MESLCLRLLVATYFYSLLTPGFILGFNFNYYFQSKSQYLSTVGHSYVQYPSFGLWYSYVFVFSTANLLLWCHLIIHHLPRSLALIAIHTRALVTWTYTPPGLISTFHPAPYLYTSMSNSNPYPSSINSPTSGCSPFYHFFCSILHIIHFCNNYLLHLVIYNLTHILGRIRPHFDLYLVIQGHSLLLYYTVSCTGFLFRLVQFFKISILIHLLTGRV